ncbi:hypothetical protein N7499_005575 [Penicillium canescens]|uniref:ER-bound oxygenase mpaB/mpaB'/Rubber oxygenase catalytic domain-containing protein n=1 Tax=Penicillium canescens TaxID=5083 RepID=A0AAD6IBX4_PENCN|nr:uncharacterized protein N7446_001341 [Penicillium canescens]KAJ5998045.1 hypothetical protein N7522_009705 [Penicillium canescens]KAJ6043145.1 hypothetical protein N7460_004500 [Penicillium canescens]KAJ6054621.1 hypothetical protein N7444_003719 [Penicillium canescens]KAJ6073564.1 hypothetical protein N7446_001341 [Penicillium canescens]KAJ6080701.1 hypothetical protein N7499_005575 [Penicillium canescens]
MSSASSVSPINLYEAGLSGINGTEKTVPTTDSRLRALEQLEILPQILQEGILLTGSGAALLLQAALPSIREEMSSGDHKQLASELLNALQAHISNIMCLVFGTRTERLDLINLLWNREAPLLGGGHTVQFAHHSNLQLWMAATIYSTSTDIYQRIYGRVDYNTAQKAYSEFTLLTNYLGIHPDTWPASRKAFWTYWDHQVAQLTVSRDAAQFAKDLRDSTDMPQWVQTMKPLLRGITIEMLPPRLREAYELRSTAMTRALYRTWMGFSVTLYPAMPKKWRSYPLRFYQSYRKGT